MTQLTSIEAWLREVHPASSDQVDPDVVEGIAKAVMKTLTDLGGGRPATCLPEGVMALARVQAILLGTVTMGEPASAVRKRCVELNRFIADEALAFQAALNTDPIRSPADGR